jgi:hypothetical protein
MTTHPDHLYSAWDAAINDLDGAVKAFRAAVGRKSDGHSEKDVAVLADDVSKRKKAAFDAWVEYVNAAGYGRI